MQACVAWGWPLVGAVLVGFGAWHLVDAVLSHWLLGIHRIRVDSDAPLIWDLAWLIVFGLLPLPAGWKMMRRGGPALLLLGAATAGAGAWAPQPPDAQGACG